MKAIVIILFLTALLGGKTELKLNTESSYMKVLGTSSLHDWESEVDEFTLDGKLVEDQIQNLELQVKVKSIKSGKSIMDDKTYDALKADKFSVIRFKAEELQITNSEVFGQGELSLAGNTKKIGIKADIISSNENEIKLQGTVKLRMTDYGVKPPTAMFGSIQTGDEVTVVYHIHLNNN